MRYPRLSAALGATALTLSLGACGNSPDSSDRSATDAEAGSNAAAGAAATEAGSLSMTDPWLKSADTGMTAAFGTLVNNGDADITILSATSDIAGAMELHETVQNDDGTMAMRPKKGGFVISAGGDQELAPGGDHLMVMDLKRPLKPGEIVTFTLTMADGSTTEIDATVKSFSGVDEDYQHGGDDESGMDMGSDEDSSGGM